MSDEIIEQGIEIDFINSKLESIFSEISKYLVGQEQLARLSVAALLCDGHILLEGAPGVAKTFTANLISKLINLSFSRIQFTPDLMPSDVTGTSIFNPKNLDFEFKYGPIFSNIVLIDEINRAPAKTQSSLFEAMQERQVTNNNSTYNLDEPFLVIATQNPIEHEGTYKLPEAQLDRFLVKLNIDYPNLENEIQILKNHDRNLYDNVLSNIAPVITKEDFLMLKNEIGKVTVDDKIIEFISTIVVETRKNNSLYLGASTRGSISILKLSKVIAVFNNRNFVIPEDVIEIVPYVLNHRIILTPEKEMEGLTNDDIIKQILSKITIPR
ncbi:AAA family ATPase [Polluticaenibacter yanchengensis]|uniref:MoxR family ATPase n=1 Tax=Polluticaenibacter yanchengensis TaxID=3014562 RepID=A0ABT4UK00_9BACT|nr:MoxR family ATPase [Chitinophagaceae bacterium LY-5]